MPAYLSPEWLEEFVTLAADQPIRPGVTVKIQYKVTDGPTGDIDYYWIVDEGRIVDAKRSTIGDSDIELDPTAAFMQGKLKEIGDVAKMMSRLPITDSPGWKVLLEKLSAVTELSTDGMRVFGALCAAPQLR